MRRSSHIEAREKSIHTWVKSIATSHSWRDATNKLSVHNISKIPFTSSLVELKPTNKELGQSHWLLCSISVNLRHIHVIDKDNHFLARSFWTVVFEGSFEQAAAIKVATEASGSLCNITICEEININNVAEHAAKIAKAYKGPGQ